MRHPILTLGLLGLCAGCSVIRSNDAEEAQHLLIGMTKPDLFSCAGLPDRTTTLGATEYLTYFNDLLTSGGLTMPIIGGGINFFDSKYCHATVTLTDSKVSSIHYSGNPSSTLAPLDQCDYIVAACVEAVKHPEKADAAPPRSAN